ncbi:MAG TPA: VWA domain-containing protein [Holophaga sp.]|nr:VWA domain-containing protein [Holophaga sp.]
MRIFRWSLLLCLGACAARMGAQELRVLPAYVPEGSRYEILVENAVAKQDATQPVRPGDAARMTLLEDGKAGPRAREMKTFASTGRGMAVVLAVDVSRSLAGRPFAEIRKALQAFARETTSRDQVALITLADDIRVDVPFHASPEALVDAIPRLDVRGRITELYKGCYKGLEMLSEPGLPARRRLVVFTDGKDEGVAYVLQDVINQAKSQGIQVDAFGVSKVDPKYLSNCERLADLTGGRYVDASSVVALEDQARGLARLLQESPVAVFPASLKGDGAEHEIGIRLETPDGARTGSARVALLRAEPARATAPTRSRLGLIVALVGGGAAVALAVLALVLHTRQKKRQAALDAADALAAKIRAREALRPPASGEEAPALPETLGSDTAVSPREDPRRTQFQPSFRIKAPAPGQPAVRLRVEGGPAQGQTFDVDADPCWIGSDEQVNVRVPEDPYVSGFHAYLRWEGGLLYLFDSQSTNGTFKNDQRLGAHSVVIAPGDRIRAGQTQLLVLSA